MRPPRFRLRTLLIAVAAVALVLGWAERHRREAALYRSRAVVHRANAIIVHVNRSIVGEPLSGHRLAYHGTMAEKYEWAERHPWMPLWPDPPAP